MTTEHVSLSEIRRRGYAALLRELGPVGYLRFIQECFPGKGDFTKERRQWVDVMSLEDIRAELNQSSACLETPGTE